MWSSPADLDEATAPAIQCHGVTRRFGDLPAVDGLDLRVPRGTVFGFLGPNGAGKTTTIRLLLGLLGPSAGEVRVLGHRLPSHGDDVRRRTGVVLEEHGLYDGLSARASLEFAARSYGLSSTDATARVGELAERLGVAARLDERPTTLSRGMRQRIAIARALVGSPALLVLDEPTNGLDAGAAAELRSLLVELVANGTTVFLTTHLLAEAERFCDEVTVIKAGRAVATGAPAELRRRASVTTVRIEGPALGATLSRSAPALPPWSQRGPDTIVVDVVSLDDVPGVVAALVGAGLAIHRVEPVGQTLEAAFLRLVGGDDATPAASARVAG